MSKLRLLFRKEAQASYISHLDLMRTFQRVFPRTELEIRHTQGFHPHPILSIVLPLPVGQQSDCELMDFEVTQESDGGGIAEKLNTGLPTGLEVLACYPAQRPVKELCWLEADISFEYDRPLPADAAEQLMFLFCRETLTVEKRTKHKDLAEVDIAPMIGSVQLKQEPGRVFGSVRVQAQNPGLNPQLLAQAVERNLPELAPDFLRVRRRRILDENGKDFR